MTLDEPRRWWLDICTPYGDPCDFISNKPHSNPSATNIEVVEASAYDAKCAEVERLRAALKGLLDKTPDSPTSVLMQYEARDALEVIDKEGAEHE